MRPPFIPAVSRDDAYYFDPEYTNKSPRDSPGGPVSASAREIFRGFSFIAPGLLDDSNNVMNGSGSAGSGAGNVSAGITTSGSANNLPEMNCATGSSASSGSNGNPPLFPSRVSPFSNEIPGVKPGAFQDEYQMGRELGRGTFSVCRLCEHRATRKQYAVKIISKAEHDCREEVEILLRYGNHANIVSLYSVHEDYNFVYLVMELLKGGELLDRILALERMSENEASAVLRTVVSAVSYLHEHGVVHRDLKPSNLLYASVNQMPDSLKLCDLGFAKQLRADNGLLMTPCYTANFVAPEVLKRQGYDLACDIWSLGVLLYIMLEGKTPFASSPNDSPEMILARIGSGHIDLETGVIIVVHSRAQTNLTLSKMVISKSARFVSHVLQIWRTVSPEAKDLLRQMLHIVPQRRPTAAQILRHPWILHQAHLPATQTIESIAASTLRDSTTAALKGAVNATFRAISSPQAANVGPVGMSALAKRRAKDKLTTPT